MLIRQSACIVVKGCARPTSGRREDELECGAADPALAQMPVGEEGELERRDRALDRQVDQVHDETPAVEVLECEAEHLGVLSGM